MHKKVTASLLALTVCANMAAGIAVSAEGAGSTADQGATKSDAKKDKKDKKKKGNPNISAEYADSALFDTSKVHTFNVICDDADWDNMVKSATEKSYINCDIEIDGELIKNCAIRTKGNASLNSVSNRRDNKNDRFSFKVEFDHNDNETTYHGLDKLALNSMGQDYTCEKDYLTYQMMNKMGVNAPLCSYTLIQRNGKDFGLYLAVEAIEDSFAKRCYGDTDVDLYKPEAYEKVDRSKMSNLGVLFQIMSGRFYADKTENDRIDIFSEVWSGKYAALGYTYEFGTVSCCRWAGDDVSAYEDFFEESVFKCTDEDKQTLVDSIKTLNLSDSQKEKLSVLDTDQLMRYFAVNNFVNNNDGLMGIMKHNFYLCEKDGVLSYVPWDYNVAFGGFHFENAITDLLGKDFILDVNTDRLSNVMSVDKNLVNFPIDTPLYTGENSTIPMMSTWLDTEEGRVEYHKIYDEYIKMFEDGTFEKMRQDAYDLIKPYVEKDLTFYTVDEFETASENMKLYLKYRSEAIRGQLDGTIPSTKEGQAADGSALIEPVGLSTGTMATNDGCSGTPSPAFLNPIVMAFLGEDPDRSIGHFSDLMLDYFRDNTTMYHRVPELMQVEQTRGVACSIVTQKYSVNSLFFTDPSANNAPGHVDGSREGDPSAGQGGNNREAGGPPADTDRQKSE